MKLRATTPVSLSRISLFFFAALFLVASIVTGIQYAKPAAADQYDDKIRALQADMARYQLEADRLGAEAMTLQTALAQITSEKNAIQAQVDLSQAQYDKLVIEIADTEKKIKENQDGLGSTLADLYVDGTVTPIEMLASSENITDFLNKQDYRSSVRDQLSATIKNVKDLKAKLDQQRADAEKVLAQQKDALNNLASKEAEQASLVAQTKSDEANYQRMIGESATQIAEAKATQALIRNRLNNTGGYTLIDSGSLAGYPWNASNCPMRGMYSLGGADGNGTDGYGYGCRQCASYVAWRIAKETGIYYRGWGNGKEFDERAVAAGYQRLSRPEPGAIAVMEPASAGQNFGHVAWVEAVNGNTVTVSQYNYNYGQGYGLYSMMNLSASAFDSYVKIK